MIPQWSLRSGTLQGKSDTIAWLPCTTVVLRLPSLFLTSPSRYSINRVIKYSFVNVGIIMGLTFMVYFSFLLISEEISRDAWNISAKLQHHYLFDCDSMGCVLLSVSSSHALSPFPLHVRVCVCGGGGPEAILSRPVAVHEVRSNLFFLLLEHFKGRGQK